MHLFGRSIGRVWIEFFGPGDIQDRSDVSYQTKQFVDSPRLNLGKDPIILGLWEIKRARHTRVWLPISGPLRGKEARKGVNRALETPRAIFLSRPARLLRLRP